MQQMLHFYMTNSKVPFNQNKKMVARKKILPSKRKRWSLPLFSKVQIFGPMILVFLKLTNLHSLISVSTLPLMCRDSSSSLLILLHVKTVYYFVEKYPKSGPHPPPKLRFYAPTPHHKINLMPPPSLIQICPHHTHTIKKVYAPPKFSIKNGLRNHSGELDICLFSHYLVGAPLVNWDHGICMELNFYTPK